MAVGSIVQRFYGNNLCFYFYCKACSSHYYFQIIDPVNSNPENSIIS